MMSKKIVPEERTRRASATRRIGMVLILFDKVLKVDGDAAEL